MRFKKFTQEQLAQAVLSSLSLRTVLNKLGITEAGGNYQTIKKAIEYCKLDASHFTGRGHLKGKSHNFKKRPIEKICVYGKHENTYNLKNRLILEKIKEEKCERCNHCEWQGSKIPLELHHIDGDKKNNQLSNLDLLCPNCHALTDNYRGKNIKIRKRT